MIVVTVKSKEEIWITLSNCSVLVCMQHFYIINLFNAYSKMYCG